MGVGGGSSRVRVGEDGIGGEGDSVIVGNTGESVREGISTATKVSGGSSESCCEILLGCSDDKSEVSEAVG